MLLTLKCQTNSTVTQLSRSPNLDCVQGHSGRSTSVNLKRFHQMVPCVSYWQVKGVIKHEKWPHDLENEVKVTNVQQFLGILPRKLPFKFEQIGISSCWLTDVAVYLYDKCIVHANANSTETTCLPRTLRRGRHNKCAQYISIIAALCLRENQPIGRLDQV
jgi:hypothetical protein